MEHNSQSRGQALVELIFLIIFAVSFSLVAEKMTKKWQAKRSTHRFVKKDKTYEEFKFDK